MTLWWMLACVTGPVECTEPAVRPLADSFTGYSTCAISALEWEAVDGDIHGRAAVLHRAWDLDAVCAASTDQSLPATLGPDGDAELWVGDGDYPYCDACGGGCIVTGGLAHSTIDAEWTATSGTATLEWAAATQTATVRLDEVVFEGESCSAAPVMEPSETWDVHLNCD